MQWFSNPVLLEWSESVEWCDVQRHREHAALLQILRRVALRGVPLGAVVFLIGMWLVGRIPGGGGPVTDLFPYVVAGLYLLSLTLPYLVLRTGIIKPQSGGSVAVKLRVRGIQFVGASGRTKGVRWSAFDAFAFGSWRNLDVLKLRLRGSWLSRRLETPGIVMIEFGSAQVDASTISGVLSSRGLHEGPLGEPSSW